VEVGQLAYHALDEVAAECDKITAEVQLQVCDAIDELSQAFLNSGVNICDQGKQKLGVCALVKHTLSIEKIGYQSQNNSSAHAELALHKVYDQMRFAFAESCRWARRGHGASDCRCRLFDSAPYIQKIEVFLQRGRRGLCLSCFKAGRPAGPSCPCPIKSLG
jgi:hypothetical protein